MHSRWREDVEEGENVRQQDPRRGRLASDSQSLPRRDSHLDVKGRAKASAEQLVGEASKTRTQVPQMEDLLEIAFAACTSDLWALKRPPETIGGDRARLFTLMTPGEGRLLRALIADEQPRTQMHKPAKAQIPDICIEEDPA